ncbi:MAG: hypothetical protein NC131_08620 [Roseburia sp.]|nr:hypothetical protein [Roseburia sp.]
MKRQSISRFYPKTGYRIPRRGNSVTVQGQAAEVRERLRTLYETYDRNHDPQSVLLQRYLLGILKLSLQFEVMQSEEEARLGGLTTSFESVEKEISRCISGCLSDCDAQSRDTAHIQALLRDYRVVTPLRDGSPSVSLGRLYSLIEDNFEGSCLRKLLGIMIAGHMNTTTQVVTF